MGEFNNFRNKTLKQIRIWAWLAAVLPITALAGIFFIWIIGSDTLFKRAMIFGEVSMFGVAVVWWWWAIFVINKLVRQWDHTREKVGEVLHELKEIKRVVQEPVDTAK
jgi:Zn-dependent protease with chaperone function